MEKHPETIGPYRVIAELGRGGMGFVYKAWHAVSGSIAAVKTVRVSNQLLLGNFRQEVAMLARLHHPGVVRIIEHGIDGGVPWYAMEFVEGLTLRRFVGHVVAERDGTDLAQGSTVPYGRQPDTGADEDCTRPGHAAAGTRSLAGSHREPPRPVGAAPRPTGLDLNVLRAVRRLCDTLAYVHGEGVVHRDLKPDNILVTAEARPVLVDFGVASQFGASGREALEIAGDTAGTLFYMAPEQIRGEFLDARADLYSLGCILFELITGRPPFVEATGAALMQAHLEREPVPPSHFVPVVPAGLDDLVLMLLAKDPRKRLGFASDVSAAIARLGIEDSMAAEDSPAPRTYLYRAPFTGRSRAVRDITERLSRLRAGAGGCLLIEGESGVGKTRLAMEIGRIANKRRISVLTGGCFTVPATKSRDDESRGTLLQGFRGPLRTIADRCRDRRLAETERVLGHRGKVLAQFEPLLNDLPGQDDYPAPVALAPDAARFRLFSYIAETLTTFAAEAPAVIIVDDIQWADELTLGLFHHLLESGSLIHKRLFLIATVRTEEFADDTRLIFAPAIVERICLERLGPDDVASMVRDMLALPSAPPRFCQFLSSHSEGNPFFVVEYLRAAVEEKLLWRDQLGCWQVLEPDRTLATISDYQRLGLPNSLRDLVDRRLARLTPEARGVVAAAAVLGREFDPGILGEVSRMSGPALAGILGELRRLQIVEAAPLGGTRFTHDKLRERAYASLPRAGRKRLHLAVATALERGRADREDLWSEIGFHWQSAGKTSRARRAFLAGARAARDRFAHAEAERLYRACLTLADTASAERIAAREELAHNVLRLNGRGAEALDELGSARLDARSLGDIQAEAESLRKLGIVLWELARMEEAREAFEQALALRAGDRAFEGITLGNLANVHLQQGRTEEARALYERSLAAHRARGDRRGEGVMLGNIAIVCFNQGDFRRARPLYEEAIAILREVGDRILEAKMLGNLALLHADSGCYDLACQLYGEALDIARKTGNRREEGIILSNFAGAAMVNAEFDQARDRNREALAITRETGNRRSEATALHVQSIIDRRTGDLDAAEQSAASAAVQLDGVGDQFFRALNLVERGHQALARGRTARDLLDAAASIAMEYGFGPGTDVHDCVAGLRRAEEAFAAGERLVRGQRLDDMTPEFRQYLIATGVLPA